MLQILTSWESTLEYGIQSYSTILLLPVIVVIVSLPLQIYDGAIGAQAMGVVDSAHFALNKFRSLSITSSYNVLPLITINYAFHTCSTEPNPCTNLSPNHNVDSYLHKLRSLSIAIWIQCSAFDLNGIWFPPSSTKPNPCTNFSLAHKSNTFITTVLEHLKPLLTITWKMLYIWPHRSNFTSKDINEIYLSIYMSIWPFSNLQHTSRQSCRLSWTGEQ